MGRKTPDLTGQRFGRLVAIRRTPHDGPSAYWLCACDCGAEKAMPSGALRRGGIVSCGCLRREKTIARNTRHGLSGTPTYGSWRNMIRRTTHPHDPRYPEWGGRGIKVCDRWLKYPAFLADMGEKPPGTTLDRIDNDGDYEPGNCQWATPVQQARNQRRAKLNAEKVQEIQHLYEQGMRISAIAAAVGVRRHTVGTVCTVLEVLTR